MTFYHNEIYWIQLLFSFCDCLADGRHDSANVRKRINFNFKWFLLLSTFFHVKKSYKPPINIWIVKNKITNKISFEKWVNMNTKWSCTRLNCFSPRIDGSLYRKFNYIMNLYCYTNFLAKSLSFIIKLNAIKRHVS